jgi:hypothetical protein
LARELFYFSMVAKPMDGRTLFRFIDKLLDTI